MRKRIVIVGVICLLCITAVIYMVFPINEKTDIVTPAIIVSKETGEVEKTTVQLKGTWSHNNINKKSVSFFGTIEIAALGYTKGGQWEIETELVTESNTQYMRGFLPYKSRTGGLEMAVIYMDSSHSVYVIYDESYMVFSPAENMEDVHKVCEAIGLEFSN